MNNRTVQLPWGAEKISIELPEEWRLTGVMEPSALPGVADPAKTAIESLQEPIGSPRLGELAQPGMKVALVIDDDSRPTPVAAFMPAVMQELQRGGVRPEDVTVVPALGVHRAMTQEEIDRRTGWPGLRSEAHDCDDPEKLVFFSNTSRGTPVSFNKTVATADLIVSIGCIEPHIIASFGGGYKNLLPGVASRAAIAHNHAINCQPTTFNNVGRPIENNPMRLDLEEAGRMLKQPVFIVNAVLNSALQVVRVVSGHPIAAHRAGVETSAAIYGVKVPGLADVIITASHPMDQDLRQGVKALANNIRALKPGGIMITLIRAEEGVGVFGLANRKLPVGKNVLKFISPLVLPLVPKLKLKGMGEEDKFFLYFALQAMNHGKLLVYGPTIPQEIHENLPFVSFVPSVQAALEQARRQFPHKADVVVLPFGGSTYPILN
jgi:nickel-dependent lactate racemase